jgi:hypothetical protein
LAGAVGKAQTAAARAAPTATTGAFMLVTSIASNREKKAIH